MNTSHNIDQDHLFITDMMPISRKIKPVDNMTNKGRRKGKSVDNLTAKGKTNTPIEESIKYPAKATTKTNHTNTHIEEGTKNSGHHAKCYRIPHLHCMPPSPFRHSPPQSSRKPRIESLVTLRILIWRKGNQN